MIAQFVLDIGSQFAAQVKNLVQGLNMLLHRFSEALFQKLKHHLIKSRFNRGLM
jgi:hypothetical protein